jgi:trimeric autotransporter adhesin
MEMRKAAAAVATLLLFFLAPVLAIAGGIDMKAADNTACSGSVSQCPIYFNNAPASGEPILVAAWWCGQNLTATVDDGVNTYLTIAGPTNAPSSSMRGQTWYAINKGGVTSLNVNLSGTTTSGCFDGVFIQTQALTGVNTLDTATVNTATGIGSSLSVTSGTPTTSSDMMFGVFMTDEPGVPFTVASGYTGVLNGEAVSLIEYTNLTSATPQTPTTNASVVSNWVGYAFGFSNGSGSSGGSGGGSGGGGGSPQPPVASNDAYTTGPSPLVVAAPGVLANATNPSGGTLTAALTSSPTNGTVTLNSDGSFTYNPSSTFSGTDSFSYQASANGLVSNIATVSINVTAPASQLVFNDTFSGTGTDSLWTTVMGTWIQAGGEMQGSSSQNNYGYSYAGNAAWANYSVQTQVQFPDTAYGGGFGGRVNTSTGAHYGIWLEPSASLLALVKFSGWTTWSGTLMAQATVPNVGTDWHTLAANFSGSTIQIYFDGIQYISATDSNFDSTAPYSSGAVSLDMWTGTDPYVISFENFAVQSSLPTAQNDSYTMLQGGTLSIAAPGVLANDTSPGGSSLTASLVSQPSHGSLTLNSDGSFTYTPTTGFTGTDSFTYQASAGGLLSNIATVTINVTVPPLLSSFTLNPTTITGGNNSTGTVTLTGPAPNGGIMVSLQITSTTAATVPASATVAAGSTTATFTVTTTAVTTTTAPTITATYGNTSFPAVLTIQPVQLTVTAISLSPTSVTGGSNSTGTVTLSGPAPAGGASVGIQSSNAAAVVPTSVTVPQGATTAPFTITTSAVSSKTTASITVSDGGTESANLTIQPPALASLTLNPTSVTGGTSSTGTITLNGPAPASGISVSLTSSKTSVGTVPSAVAIAAGATSGTFTITTSAVSSQTSTTIRATYGSASKSANLTVTVP